MAMKRHIYILMVLLVAMTSCEVSEGYEREPMDVGRYIVQNVEREIDRRITPFDLALLGDWYLGSTDDAERSAILQNSRGYLFVMQSDTVKVKRLETWSGLYEDFSYFVTDGKLLSEGGTWRGSRANVTIASSVDGYEVSFDDVPAEQYICYTQGAFTVTDVVRSVEDGVNYSFSGNMTTVDKEHSSTHPLMLDVAISDMRRYNASKNISGRVEITCTDNYYDTVDEVVVDYRDAGGKEISYLGERELVE